MRFCAAGLLRDDGEEFNCLDSTAFAEYVIRIVRAHVGSRRGGFVDRLLPNLWKTSDGEMIKRGLAFLETCVIWATARLNSAYAHRDPDEDGAPESLACAIPELVAARFAYKLRCLSIICDQKDLERRFPAWAKVKEKRIAEVRARLNQLADLIAATETGLGEKSPPTHFPSLAPGTLVYNENVGVTALLRASSPTQFWLADCSKAGDAPGNM